LIAAEAAVIRLFGDIQPPPDVGASSSENSCVVGVNPMIVLNRLRPGTTYVNVGVDISDNSSPKYRRFACVIDDVSYMGTGLSKKLAKANAAAEALEKVFGLSCSRSSSEFIFVLFIELNALPQIKLWHYAPLRSSSSNVLVDISSLVYKIWYIIGFSNIEQTYFKFFRK